MQKETPIVYYMVVDEKPTGPLTLDEITLHPALTPETLVWKPGIDNWVAAKTFPELAPAFINSQNQQFQSPPEYNRTQFQGEEEMRRPGNQQNPYNEGYNNHGPQVDPNPFANNPQYQSHHTYHNQQRHYYEDYNNPNRNGYRQNMRTNWLPWAIVATVLGFFTSCIGAIFGIIAIVQANKANTLYAQRFDREGDAANSNAKIMTIIGLIFAGLGIIFAFYFGSLFSSFSNLSYL